LLGRAYPKLLGSSIHAPLFSYEARIAARLLLMSPLVGVLVHL
jgi:hypothetical protein